MYSSHKIKCVVVAPFNEEHMISDNKPSSVVSNILVKANDNNILFISLDSGKKKLHNSNIYYAQPNINYYEYIDFIVNILKEFSQITIEVHVDTKLAIKVHKRLADRINNIYVVMHDYFTTGFPKTLQKINTSTSLLMQSSSELDKKETLYQKYRRFIRNAGLARSFYDKSKNKKYIKRHINLIAVSDYVNNYHSNRFAKSTRIYNSYGYLKDVYNLPAEPKENIITFLGRPYMLKGFKEFIIAALDILDYSSSYKVHLYLIYNSDVYIFKEYYHSSRFQDFLQAGRIKIEYNLSPIDVYKNLLKSKIVVMPSYSEAFGLAAMEGALAGNALVISNSGGLPEVIGNDKSRGYILPEISSQAVYNALVYLINTSYVCIAIASNAARAI